MKNELFSAEIHAVNFLLYDLHDLRIEMEIYHFIHELIERKVYATLSSDANALIAY